MEEPPTKSSSPAEKAADAWAKEQRRKSLESKVKTEQVEDTAAPMEVDHLPQDTAISEPAADMEEEPGEY